jgi:hypothetical protein
MNNSNDIKKQFMAVFFNNIYLKRAQHITWNILHSFSVFYPDSPSEQLQQNTKLFINNLKTYLPFCSSCSNNIKDNFIQNYNIDFAVSNKNELILFFINYHSYINTSFTNNPNYDSSIFTIEYVINKYSDNTYNEYFKTNYNLDLLTIISEEAEFSTFQHIFNRLRENIVIQIKNINFNLIFEIK